jgi:hypothetical protein
MKGIDNIGAALVHVPGWVGEWMGRWMDGIKSRFKDCLQQSTKKYDICHIWSHLKPTFQCFYVEKEESHLSCTTSVRFLGMPYFLRTSFFEI